MSRTSIGQESRICQKTMVFIRSQDSVLFSKSSQNKDLSLVHQTHLVPAHVGGGLNHVVAMPSRDGHEGNSGGVVADLWTKG